MIAKMVLAVLAAIFVCLTLQTPGVTAQLDRFETEILNISGTWYIFDWDWHYRAQAQALCNQYNARLVTFDNKEKWMTVTDYLYRNGYTLGYIWSGGVRDENSNIWYWDLKDRQEITEFYWAENEPSMESTTERLCLNFYGSLNGPESGAWFDDDCTSYGLGVMCEFVETCLFK